VRTADGGNGNGTAEHGDGQWENEQGLLHYSAPQIRSPRSCGCSNLGRAPFPVFELAPILGARGDHDRRFVVSNPSRQQSAALRHCQGCHPVAAAPDLAALVAGLGRRAHRRAGDQERVRLCPRRGGWLPASIVVVESEADLQSDLVMRTLAVLDMAPRLDHLEPANLAQRARCTADGVADRVLDALFRRACDLDYSEEPATWIIR
jgi:hypothetical protein